MDIKCPNHPDTNLQIGDDIRGTYVLGARSDKAKELNGVGFCPACNLYRAFTVKK